MRENDIHQEIENAILAYLQSKDRELSRPDVVSQRILTQVMNNHRDMLENTSGLMELWGNEMAKDHVWEAALRAERTSIVGLVDHLREVQEENVQWREIDPDYVQSATKIINQWACELEVPAKTPEKFEQPTSKLSLLLEALNLNSTPAPLSRRK